jgi:hypothetical protein
VCDNTLVVLRRFIYQQKGAKMARYNTVIALLVLICGAFVFYTESKPIAFEGKFITGGGYCSGEINRRCTSQEGFTCTIYTTLCIAGGSNTCTTLWGAGSAPCYSSISRCQNERVQDCN